MALRINLYHEVLRTKKQEQYDPLKLSIIGVIIVLTGLMTWYFIELGSRRSAQDTLRHKEEEYNRLVPQEKLAKDQEADYTKRIAIMDGLSKRIEGRFYWAPVLEDLAVVVPPNVQTTRLAADVTGEGLRKTQMTVEGIAAGDEPRATAEEFRTALVDRLSKRYKNTVATFKSLDDNADSVTLNGKSMRTAAFSINVTFTSGIEPPPPPPTPRAARGKKAAPQDQ